MITAKLSILGIKVRKGISQKTGRPYEIFAAQCMFTDRDGEIVVGRMNLPNDLKETPAGEYLCEFELAVDMDGSVVPRIVALNAVGAKVAAPVSKAA